MNILQALVDELGLDADLITVFANTAPYRYKVYQIPKRNSAGMRTIAHPSKELKIVQRLLVDILSGELRVHDNAYAYITGKSIRDNALRHKNSRYLLKMDFTNFFPSITPDLFLEKLASSGIDTNAVDRNLLTKILFRRPVRHGALELSIGAPSSPLISNFVMYDFDVALSEACEDNNITYTRYADDLTFSTSRKGLLSELANIVIANLAQTTGNSIQVNAQKTVHSSKAHNRHVTGITLTNDDSLSIGRSRKRLISSMIHKFSHNQLPPIQVPRLQGLISFASYIEPDFYQRMERKYGKEVLQEIKKPVDTREI